MGPVTEIAILPLQAGVTHDDLARSGSVWQDTIHTVLKQEGAQQCYWGTLVEEARLLRFFVDWDSLEAHQKFQDSPAYGPFVDRLMSILDGTPTLYHSSLTPHPPSVALSDETSPVTELLTVYFPASITVSDQSKLDKDLRHLLVVIEKAHEGYTGCAVGWSIEEVAMPTDPSRKAKAYLIAVGWQSIEECKKFHDTQEYKDNIHLLSDAEDMQQIVTAHTHLTEVRL